MENNYNYTPLTLLFSPNCQKCAIVNLKHAQKAPLGQSFCLPVRRGLIVTDDVIESPNSLVIPEAANRETSAEVVIKRMLEGIQ